MAQQTSHREINVFHVFRQLIGGIYVLSAHTEEGEDPGRQPAYYQQNNVSQVMIPSVLYYIPGIAAPDEKQRIDEMHKFFIQRYQRQIGYHMYYSCDQLRYVRMGLKKDKKKDEYFYYVMNTRESKHVRNPIEGSINSVYPILRNRTTADEELRLCLGLIFREPSAAEIFTGEAGDREFSASPQSPSRGVYTIGEHIFNQLYPITLQPPQWESMDVASTVKRFGIYVGLGSRLLVEDDRAGMTTVSLFQQGAFVVCEMDLLFCMHSQTQTLAEVRQSSQLVIIQKLKHRKRGIFNRKFIESVNNIFTQNDYYIIFLGPFDSKNSSICWHLKIPRKPEKNESGHIIYDAYLTVPENGRIDYILPFDQGLEHIYHRHRYQMLYMPVLGFNAFQGINEFRAQYGYDVPDLRIIQQIVQSNEYEESGIFIDFEPFLVSNYPYKIQVSSGKAFGQEGPSYRWYKPYQQRFPPELVETINSRDSPNGRTHVQPKLPPIYEAINRNLFYLPPDARVILNPGFKHKETDENVFEIEGVAKYQGLLYLKKQLKFNEFDWKPWNAIRSVAQQEWNGLEMRFCIDGWIYRIRFGPGNYRKYDILVPGAGR